MITNISRRICYLSPAYPGKVHDYAILKSEFPVGQGYFDGTKILVDSGFTGMDKDYPEANVTLPKKKPKGGQRSEEEKIFNRELSQKRVVVEHGIGGMRRFGVLSDKSRTKLESYYDAIVVTCAGLWNFYLSS